MASKTDLRREKLRSRLIDIAESTIEAKGLAGLRARDLAQQAGCSVGAIYTVVEDLEALVMAVNARTFARLGAEVAASVADRSDTPQNRLIAMSRAYLHFAAANTRLWRAMFDFEMSSDSAAPAWYLAEIDRLFEHIAIPLRELFPDWTEERRQLMVRALFSSVHGIVMLGLERRISAVPEDQLEEMIALVLSNVTSQTVS